MGKLYAKDLKGLLTKPPGRHADGDGLYFKTMGLGRAYWTYRYTVGGKGRETSLGPFPEVLLDEARVKHAELRAAVLKKIDPRATASMARPSAKPTFGQCAAAYIRAHEPSWRNAKHARQWSQTLTAHAASIRDTPVDQVTTADVLRVLTPIWNEVPETASRLRARIETIIDFAKADDETRPNPARWKGHLANKLPNPRKVGKPRGHHAAMDYRDLPEFMARLMEIDSVASRALQFTILTCARSDETLGMPWSEISNTATWFIPAVRMKMKKPHDVPLSHAALAILRAQEAERGQNPFVFAGRPMRPLSGMAMSVLLRRMKVDATVHGMRSSFRMWAADVAQAPFEVAEQCLAHVTGNAVVQAYQRSSMLERRRPLMTAWAKFLTGETGDNVIELRRTGA
jgi:integrase